MLVCFVGCAYDLATCLLNKTGVSGHRCTALFISVRSPKQLQPPLLGKVEQKKTALCSRNDSPPNCSENEARTSGLSFSLQNTMARREARVVKSSAYTHAVAGRLGLVEADNRETDSG